MKIRTSLKKRIALVEDDSDLRNSYTLMINSAPEFGVVGAYSSCEECLKDISHAKPDIVLMDINLPGMNGIDGIKLLKARDPFVDIIMMTVHDDSHLVFNAFKAGACGYISKNADYTEVLRSLSNTAKGGAHMSSKIARLVVETFHVRNNGLLARKETQVLLFLSVGKTYTQIADEMAISKETVKTHIKNIYRKLGVNRKSDAIEKGWAEHII
ncbi:MAG TPA: response regulator transcription factor [Ohtaekwangia sp.]|nr:response regulator transcription factor [Ohtaekwangia sp.]